jgi:hypothetical protein
MHWLAYRKTKRVMKGHGTVERINGSLVINIYNAEGRA